MAENWDPFDMNFTFTPYHVRIGNFHCGHCGATVTNDFPIGSVILAVKSGRSVKWYHDDIVVHRCGTMITGVYSL